MQIFLESESELNRNGEQNRTPWSPPELPSRVSPELGRAEEGEELGRAAEGEEAGRRGRGRRGPYPGFMASGGRPAAAGSSGGGGGGCWVGWLVPGTLGARRRGDELEGRLGLRMVQL